MKKRRIKWKENKDFMQVHKACSGSFVTFKTRTIARCDQYPDFALGHKMGLIFYNGVGRADDDKDLLGINYAV